MSGDLGAGTPEVHATAAEVLRFWLEEVPPERHFAKDAVLDAEIARRFAGARAAVVSSAADGWRDTAETALAAIILIDQFSRNLFRGQAEAFAADPLARELAEHAIAQGWDRGLGTAERQFLYMPLMHSEDPADQARSLALFATVDANSADFARCHADQITRFGRFPGRNAALGRTSTAEEEPVGQAGRGLLMPYPLASSGVGAKSRTQSRHC